MTINVHCTVQKQICITTSQHHPRWLLRTSQHSQWMYDGPASRSRLPSTRLSTLTAISVLSAALGTINKQHRLQRTPESSVISMLLRTVRRASSNQYPASLQKSDQVNPFKSAGTGGPFFLFSCKEARSCCVAFCTRFHRLFLFVYHQHDGPSSRLFHDRP